MNPPTALDNRIAASIVDTCSHPAADIGEMLIHRRTGRAICYIATSTTDPHVVTFSADTKPARIALSSLAHDGVLCGAFISARASSIDSIFWLPAERMPFANEFVMAFDDARLIQVAESDSLINFDFIVHRGRREQVDRSRVKEMPAAFRLDGNKGMIVPSGTFRQERR